MADGDQLCKELLRFLHSIDETGVALRQAISEVHILDPEAIDLEPDVDALVAGTVEQQQTTLALAPPPATTVTATTSLPLGTTADEIGAPPQESPRKSHQSHFRHPSAPPITAPSSSQLTPGAGTGSRTLASPAVITSPFQLTSPRPYLTPPSPRTVRMPDQGYIPDAPAVPEEEGDDDHPEAASAEGTGDDVK